MGIDLLVFATLRANFSVAFVFFSNYSGGSKNLESKLHSKELRLFTVQLCVYIQNLLLSYIYQQQTIKIHPMN